MDTSRDLKIKLDRLIAGKKELETQYNTTVEYLKKTHNSIREFEKKIEELRQISHNLWAEHQTLTNLLHEENAKINAVKSELEHRMKFEIYLQREKDETEYVEKCKEYLRKNSSMNFSTLTNSEIKGIAHVIHNKKLFESYDFSGMDLLHDFKGKTYEQALQLVDSTGVVSKKCEGYVWVLNSPKITDSDLFIKKFD